MLLGSLSLFSYILPHDRTLRYPICRSGTEPFLFIGQSESRHAKVSLADSWAPYRCIVVLLDA
jgi:hypothetical protein